MVTRVGLPRGHERHLHEKIVEVCYLAKGIFHWWVAGNSFEAKAGDLVVLPPNILHGSLDSTLQPCEYYVAYLDPAKLNPVLASIILGDDMGGHYPNCPQVGEIVKQIYDEHSGGRPHADEVCGALAALLITTLARERAAAAHEVTDAYLIDRAKRLLDSAPMGELSVAQLAEKMSISTVWLTRVFQDSVGVPPGQWIRSQQLDKAKHLLVDTEMDISSIAFALGFSTSQYFATVFRRQTGWTPTAYRQQNLVVQTSASL